MTHRNKQFSKRFSRRMERYSSRHPNDYGIRLAGGTWHADNPLAYVGFLAIDGLIRGLGYVLRAAAAAIGAAIDGASNPRLRR